MSAAFPFPVTGHSCIGRKAAARAGPVPATRQPNAMEHEESTVPTLEEPLLTATDVARLLAVPRSTVYEYARRIRDPLPCLRIGRHRRFFRSDIERWLVRQSRPRS